MHGPRLALMLSITLAVLPVILTGQQRSTKVVEAANQQSVAPVTYYALVIGNNSYQLVPKLNTPESDAKEIESVLRVNYGFHTRLLINATRQQILSALAAFRRDLDANANLLVYYAGHGYFDRDAARAYWLPIDASADDNSNWISADDITASLRSMPAQHVLIISDSCYSGTLSRAVENRTAGTAQRDRFLQKMFAGKSRTLMASGGNEPVADDGGGGNHSVFANALLKGLRQMEWSQFTANELFSLYIQERVGGNATQTPEYDAIRDSGHESGDFVFIKANADAKNLTSPVTPGTGGNAPPTPTAGEKSPASDNDKAAMAARARAELRDRGIGTDVKSIQDALIATDVDVLKLFTAAAVQPTVIEEAFRQKAGENKQTVARRFFENSVKSPEAIKWFAEALSNGVNPNFTVPSDYYDHEGVLLEAMRAANVPAIKVLLAHGASPHAYQNLFLTRYSLTRFLFPLRYIADDDRLSVEEKQDLTKAFINAGVAIPRIIDPGESGWPAEMLEARNLRDKDAPRLNLSLSPSEPFCKNQENPICKRAGGDWCTAISKMPNKISFDYKRSGSNSAVYDVSLLHLLNIEGNKAFFLALTRFFSFEYVLVEVTKDSSSWTIMRYMPPEAGMGICKQDSDGYQSDYCWRRIPLRRVVGTDEMHFEDSEAVWHLSREDCSAIYPKEAIQK